jgi:hypothetical protein
MHKKPKMDLAGELASIRAEIKSEAEEQARQRLEFDFDGGGSVSEDDTAETEQQIEDDERPYKLAAEKIIACFKDVSGLIGRGDAYGYFKAFVDEHSNNEKFIKKYGPRKGHTCVPFSGWPPTARGAPAKSELDEFTAKEKDELAISDRWIKRGGTLFALARELIPNRQGKNFDERVDTMRTHLKRLRAKRDKRIATLDWMARRTAK